MTLLSHLWHFTKTGGRPMATRVSRWRSLAHKIIAMSDRLGSVSDDELLKRGQDLKWRAKSGEPLGNLLPEAYSLIREVAWRVLKQKHYPVQIMGGIGLFEGGLAEMQTGEGKTLTATLPTFLRALPGRGCHVVTVNDYLAERDCQLMRPVYERLGLSVGNVLSETKPGDRRIAYHRDITYATSREIGFDFLRDRLKVGSKLDELQRPKFFASDDLSDDGPVQRGHYFALVDEADSVLIDDASTPLIIGLNKKNTEATEAVLKWANELAPQLEDRADFHIDPGQRNVELTDTGTTKVVMAPKPLLLSRYNTEKLYTYVEQALRAHKVFDKGRDYVINAKQEISIVDEGTGRTLEGRKWQAGLHQAVEAKEGVPITDETGEAARVTVQTFFRRYENIAGMTGTGWPARREFKKTYHLGTTVIPTHRRCKRKGLKPRIFFSQEAKRNALVPEIERLYQSGRAVLVGTPSVHASEILGKALRERNIDCQILNALLHEQEAAIVAEAGQPRRVTIATNMAGRGTDIHLHPDVKASGGLHVIATEMHSSARIDRQLVGRAARQGDPGTYQFWLSLEDELFTTMKPEKLKRLRAKARPNKEGELSRGWLRAFRRVQKMIENRDIKHRKQQLEQERQRAKMCQSVGLDPFLELAE